MNDLQDHLINNWNEAKKFKVQQKESEWIKFISLVDTIRPKNILEIGSYDGGTTVSLSLLCERLLTIEIIPSRYDVNLIKKNCDFTYLEGDSTASDIINFVKFATKEPFDVLFIDGNHHYELVKKDFLNYKKFVRPGGIIAFHDIMDSVEHEKLGPMVEKLWKEIKDHYTHIEFIEPPLDWGGIGVLWMP